MKTDYFIHFTTREQLSSFINKTLFPNEEVFMWINRFDPEHIYVYFNKDNKEDYRFYLDVYKDSTLVHFFLLETNLSHAEAYEHHLLKTDADYVFNETTI